MFALRFSGIDGARHEVLHIPDFRMAQRDAQLLRIAGVAEVAIVREATGSRIWSGGSEERDEL